MPTVIVTAGILWLTLAPHPVPEPKIELFEGADKVVHGIMFFVFTLALMYDVSDYRNRWRIVGLAAIGACAVAFAGLDEWAQGAMQLGRSTDINDFWADCTGILAAILCVGLPNLGKK